MALIPSVLQGISEDVPGLGQVQPANRTGAALASSGGAVASGALDLLTEVKQTEARDTSSKAYYGDIQASTDYLAKLKLSSPDGYVHKDPTDPTSPRVKNDNDGTERTISQEFQEWSDARYQKNQEELPTAMAQNIYKQRSQEYFNRELGVLKAEQLKRQVESYDVNQDDTIRKFRDQLVSTPDTQMAYQISQDISKDIKSQVGRLYDGTTAHQKIQALNSVMAESLMEGARSSVMAPIRQDQLSGAARTQKIDQWRSVLAGTDGDSVQRKRGGLYTISDMLAPDKKAEIDRQLIKLYDNARASDFSDLATLVDNTETALKNNTASLGQISFITAQVKKAVAEEVISPVKAAEYQARLTGAGVAGNLETDPNWKFGSQAYRDQQIAESLNRTHGAAQTILGGMSDTADVGQKAGYDNKAAAQARSDRIQSAMQTDYPAYLQDPSNKGSPVQGLAQKLDFSNPASFSSQTGTVQTLIRNTESAYKNSFPNESQYERLAALTKDQSKILSDKLKDITRSTDTSTQDVLALKKAYGKYFPDLLEQMIRDKNLGEDWRVAGHNPQAISTMDVVGALKGENQFKKTFEGAGFKEEDLNKSVRLSSDIKSYVASQKQKDPNQPLVDADYGAMQTAVKSKAMQMLSSGETSSINDAVDKATHALITRNGTMISSGHDFLPFGWFGASRSSEKSQIFLPKQMGDYIIGDVEAKKVTEYLNTHTGVDALKAYQILPTQRAKQSNSTDEFYKKAAQTTRFTLDPGNRGFNVWYKDDNSATFQKALVKGPDGNSIRPLFIPIRDILEPKK